MMTLERAKERAFDRCTMMGEDVDIYKVLYSYKAIRDLDDKEVDKIYDWIARGQGFVR